MFLVKYKNCLMFFKNIVQALNYLENEEKEQMNNYDFDIDSMDFGEFDREDIPAIKRYLDYYNIDHEEIPRDSTMTKHKIIIKINVPKIVN